MSEDAQMHAQTNENPSLMSLLDLDPEHDMVAHQKRLEELFYKNQLLRRIRREFRTCPDFDFIEYMKDVGIPVAFGLDLLVQMALHKRATLETMIGLLRHRMGGNVQDTADMILECCEADLADWSDDEKKLIVRFTLSQDVQDDLDRFQFPLPMVVPPRHLEKNSDIPFLLKGGRASVLLKDNHHEEDVCLDHLNRANRVCYSLNDEVARMVKNRWKNLDRVKEGEDPIKFFARQRAFEKYDRTAKDVIGLVTRFGNRFFLVNRYDKRGRVYTTGYHVNPQGNDWNKAMIEFAHQERIEE